MSGLLISSIQVWKPLLLSAYPLHKHKSPCCLSKVKHLRQAWAKEEGMGRCLCCLLVMFLSLKIHESMSVMCVSQWLTCVCKSLSRVQLFVIPWPAARQAPLSMEFSSQEYWSGLSFPSSGCLPDPGIKLGSPALQADSLPSEPPGKPHVSNTIFYNVISNISVKCQSLSRARLFATPWTAALQAPLSMRFSRQGYWSGLPFPSPGDLPNPGIEPGSPNLLQADSLPSEPPGKPHVSNTTFYNVISNITF